MNSPSLRTFARTSTIADISFFILFWLIEKITPTTTLVSSRFLRLEKLTVSLDNHSGNLIAQDFE